MKKLNDLFLFGGVLLVGIVALTAFATGHWFMGIICVIEILVLLPNTNKRIESELQKYGKLSISNAKRYPIIIILSVIIFFAVAAIEGSKIETQAPTKVDAPIQEAVVVPTNTTPEPEQQKTESETQPQQAVVEPPKIEVEKKEEPVTQEAAAVPTVTPEPTPTAAPAPVKTAPASSGVVKMSSTGICHAPGTTYYSRTTNFTSYNSIDDCLDAGGRLPKR